MFFMEQHNLAVYDLLLLKFTNAKNNCKRDLVEFEIRDFDGVKYFVSTAGDDKDLLDVSINLRYFKELQSHGADTFLRSQYPGYIQDKPNDNCNVTLRFNLNNLPDDIEGLAMKAAYLKRNCFASIFHKYFDIQGKLEKGEKIEHSRGILHYRPDETLYINASSDRVTVIFSTLFRDGNDAILGKLFLQEFGEGRRASQTAPQVLFRTREPPAELTGVKDALVGENVGYVTFVLFPRHTKPQFRDTTIDLLHVFRDYLHYHIKCSKAYLHSRLRSKTAEFVKVLNRAKPMIETAPEKKKTITGKTFALA